MKQTEQTSGQKLASEVAFKINEHAKLLREWKAGRDVDKRLALRLYKCADKFALLPRDLKLMPHLLDQFDLDPGDLTVGVIALANHLDRTHAEMIADAVVILNKMTRLSAIQKKLETVPKPVNPLIYGHKPLAVVRWMGAEAWPLATAVKVIRELGANLETVTIAKHLEAGRKQLDEFGSPAALNEDAANSIYELF